MDEVDDRPEVASGRASAWPRILTLAAAVLMVGWLRAGGRLWVCSGPSPWNPWWGEAWSSHTSQHLLDPYSFTHVLHGFLFAGFLHLVSRGRLPLPWLICLAVIGEGVWELVENSPTVIERYRSQTAALDYSGDSILNSVGDLLCCASGAWISVSLGLRRSVVVFLAVEAALLLWIRDSLLLNMVMLIHPLEALQRWQQGVGG